MNKINIIARRSSIKCFLLLMLTTLPYFVCAQTVVFSPLYSSVDIGEDFSHSLDDSIRVEPGTTVEVIDFSRIKAQFLRR